MKKFYLITLMFIITGIIFSGFINNQEPDKHPEVDWTLSCQECHADVTPDIYDDWSLSKHGKVNFGCYICHGDGQETFYIKGNDARCAGCHAEQLESFENSKFNSCFDCHSGHTLKFHND